MSRKPTICGYMGCTKLTTESKCPDCAIKAVKDYEKACGRECLGCKKLITSRKAKVCPDCYEKGVRECLNCKATFTDKYYKICGTCFENGVRQCVNCKKVITTGYKMCSDCYEQEQKHQAKEDDDDDESPINDAV